MIDRREAALLKCYTDNVNTRKKKNFSQLPPQMISCIYGTQSLPTWFYQVMIEIEMFCARASAADDYSIN